MANYKGLKIIAHQDIHKYVYDEIEKLNLDKNIEILILASGSGAFDKRLYNNGYKNITSCEININSYKNNSSYIKELKQIDLNKEFSLEFKQKYDLIIAIEIIEHMYNIKNFLEQGKNLMKDQNSFLIISTPNVNSIWSRIIFILFGHPYRFLVKPYLYGHVSPIFFNILEHHIEYIGLKKYKYLSKGNFIRGFTFYGFKSYIYITMVFILFPIVYLFSFFYRKHLFGTNNIFILKNL